MIKYLLTIVISILITNVFGDNIESINIASRVNVAESQSRAYCHDKTRCDTILVNKFYISNNFTPIWIRGQKLTPMADQFIKDLENSTSEGLNPNDYDLNEIKVLMTKLNDGSANPTTALDLELSLTNAFFTYSANLAFGRIDNRRVYPNWIIKKRSFDLLNVLNGVVKSQNLESGLTVVNPKFTGYYTLKNELNKYQAIAANGGFNTIPAGNTLKLNSTGLRVKLLNKRLIATGELNSNDITNYNNYSHATKKAVLLFQENNGIRPTGIVDSNTLKALNIPISDLINKISINLDRMRWLPESISLSYILVNIPDFSLHVVESNNLALSMPIIVGKEGTKSCVLDSNISYMELNPYWNVPKSIALKDTLPKLRESANYLQQKGFIVYRGKISESTRVNGSQINWKTVTPANFDYVFRQNPSDQNALGKIKFIFPNDCGIYLHDTPEHNLFKKQKRAYSHGCIRVGDPIGLATYLLRDQPAYSEEVIQAQIDSGKRKVITPKNKEEIHIVYLTSWVNESGQLQFRPDIYGIDRPTTKR